ncbi:hypothetical protein HanRHA438_Chr12g0571101 [Helianthus annuus]|nr:hypothetical protein HanRHA438_Chr12g0571101 [Helianthus annuus]
MTRPSTYDGRMLINALISDCSIYDKTEFGGGTLMAAACNVVWLCWSASRRAPCAPFDYYDFSNKLLN